jgi:uncharacterized membrane protein YsdA (DUF1294 family)/cold shock CspA family protein
MRFEGTLKTWNDERGFGFIVPVQGGDEIFVHIKAFSVRTGRPAVNQPVSFEVEIGPQGKKRAKNVEPIRAARSARRMQSNSPAQWGVASFFAIAAFLALYLIVASVWRVPGVYAVVYALASLVCFLAYAVDKSAATAGRWRTPESTLLLLGLAGGWPGAILAQQFLRHKSNKAAFRSAFWATVVINVAAFVLWFSPFMAHIRP